MISETEILHHSTIKNNAIKRVGNHSGAANRKDPAQNLKANEINQGKSRNSLECGTTICRNRTETSHCAYLRRGFCRSG